MTRRWFSSVALATTLNGAIDGSTPTIVITTATGHPSSYPYPMIIDPNLASEEIVDVTNRSGTTLTCTRGVDGTTAVSHLSGAVIQHGFSGRDFTEAYFTELGIAVSDETTAITTGTAKVTFRMPYAMNVTSVRANLNTASSSGNPTVDINEGGVSILSTKLSIDANEKTSTTAATAAVISDADLADDAEMTIDIDTAGTGAKGLKVWLIGYRTS